MNIGIGLPIGAPTTLLDWARRVDAGPFRTLGLLDRLVSRGVVESAGCAVVW